MFCKTNENGQQSFELCRLLGVSVPNSYFQANAQHRVSWCYTSSLVPGTDDLFLVCEINRGIEQAYSTFATLIKSVYVNRNLTTNTKLAAFKACVLSTLIYNSKNMDRLLQIGAASQRLPSS